MTPHMHTPLKIHVTGVTRVTTFGKRPNSLTLTPVTLMSDFPYTFFDADQTCNARATPYLLLADLGLGVRRWIRLHDTGRGTETNTKGQQRCR